MALTAFWIALAAVLIAGNWRQKHLEEMRRFSDDAFVTGTMQQVRRARSRALLTRRVLQALGIASLAAISPFLMRGAARIFGELESLFTVANRALETPAGTVIAILCSIAFVLLSLRAKRR